LRNKKILITGGAGFIGSNLCKKLVSENEIFSLDNYSTGTVKNHHEGVKYIEADTKEISNNFSVRFDYVFHLGEYSRVEKSIDEYYKVWEYNVHGTNEVIKYCKKYDCKLIYAGSSTKYYNNNNGSKLTPYTFFKAQNTELIINYSKWYKLNYAIAYFYNVYGDNEIDQGEYSTVVGKFINLFHKKEPLTIVKPGTQTRHFTNVNDIVEALILIAKKGKGDGYGIGSEEKMSIIELAKLFKCEYKFIDERVGNRKNSILNNEKLYKLGWKAKTSIEDYIDKKINSID